MIGFNNLGNVSDIPKLTQLKIIIIFRLKSVVENNRTKFRTSGMLRDWRQKVRKSQKSNENMKISSVLQGKETSERKKEIEKRESEKKSGQAQKNMKRVVGRIEDSMSSTQKEQIAKFRLTIFTLLEFFISTPSPYLYYDLCDMITA